MRQLIGSHKVDELILRQMFLQRLPQNVQQILTISSRTTDLEELAKMADDIMDVLSNNGINSVSTEAVPPSPSTSMKDAPMFWLLSQLTSQMQDLRLEVSELRAQRNQSHTVSKQRRSRSRRRSRTPSQSRNICWYHRRYGHNALKCIRPCMYNSSNSSQGNSPARQ
uniref:Uncharacterized protein n=1 Tax=Trichobilharzia regenti TaxID=157069 RepID=A0AA85JSN2_TRIRE|nr:unnamed protein product [Trichobilharzia regenti]